VVPEAVEIPSALEIAGGEAAAALEDHAQRGVLLGIRAYAGEEVLVRVRLEIHEAGKEPVEVDRAVHESLGVDRNGSAGHRCRETVAILEASAGDVSERVHDQGAAVPPWIIGNEVVPEAVEVPGAFDIGDREASAALDRDTQGIEQVFAFVRADKDRLAGIHLEPREAFAERRAGIGRVLDRAGNETVARDRESAAGQRGRESVGVGQGSARDASARVDVLDLEVPARKIARGTVPVSEGVPGSLEIACQELGARSAGRQ
jgi:hypothetical protein